jgi:hypothetical protein
LENLESGIEVIPSKTFSPVERQSGQKIILPTVPGGPPLNQPQMRGRPIHGAAVSRHGWETTNLNRPFAHNYPTPAHNEIKDVPLNPSDLEITYLFGLAQLASGELQPAAGSFAKIYRANGSLVSKALENLHGICKMLPLDSRDTFESFVQQAERQDSASSNNRVAAAGSPSVQTLSDYAGSDSCRGCHSSVYRQWSQTGMSKMLRPYAPQNVVGDFQDKNEFYLGDEAAYREGRVEFANGRKGTLFPRMVMRDGRHYFDIQQSDGKLHTYPVDYTIGSKFQQAYATKLPNGEIHVFPIQYNALQKRWINYWRIIDGAASERADLRSWEKLSAATSYQAIRAVCHTSQLRNVKGGGFDVKTCRSESRALTVRCAAAPRRSTSRT